MMGRRVALDDRSRVIFSMAIIAFALVTCGRRPLKNEDPKAGGARTVDPKTGTRHLDFPYWIEMQPLEASSR